MCKGTGSATSLCRPRAAAIDQRRDACVTSYRVLPDAEIGRTAKKGRLKSLSLLSLLYTSCSIIVHIVLDNITGNCINSIVVLCSAGIEFNFIFHSAIIILQLCFCKLYI